MASWQKIKYFEKKCLNSKDINIMYNIINIIQANLEADFNAFIKCLHDRHICLYIRCNICIHKSK